MEPSECPRMFHDLVESDPLVTDVAFVSILQTRASKEFLKFSVRVLTFCSIAAKDAILAESVLTVSSTLVILEVIIPTASQRVLTWLSKSANPRASGGKMSRISLHCASSDNPVRRN